MIDKEAKLKEAEATIKLSVADEAPVLVESESAPEQETTHQKTADLQATEAIPHELSSPVIDTTLHLSDTDLLAIAMQPQAPESDWLGACNVLNQREHAKRLLKKRLRRFQILATGLLIC